MIGIEGVPDPSTPIDPNEAGLILPVPGPQANAIVLEARDGQNIQTLTARSAELTHNGRTVFRVRDVRIDVYITDTRVALACSKYDKGGGWIGSPTGMILLNTVSKTRAALRRRGKMMVGQVRYPWVQRVGSTAASRHAERRASCVRCETSQGGCTPTHADSSEER